MKSKAEWILSFYMIAIVAAALILMRVEFVKTFFGLPWDSSLSWGSKVLLALGWGLFPAIHVFLSKTLGNLAFLPGAREPSTPTPWRVAGSVSKTLSQVFFRKN